MVVTAAIVLVCTDIVSLELLIAVDTGLVGIGFCVVVVDMGVTLVADEAR